MLGSIRKFSTSIYAKILLGIIVIPFVFWGMGPVFKGGSKNVIVVINKDKYSVQEFGNFIQKFAPRDQKISSNLIEEMLYAFIGEKLIEKDVEYFDIKLSDNSLSKLIKHQKYFKKGNKFSRIEYEKFLLKNNIAAATFESNLSSAEKKKQLLDFIGGGIIPSKFLVNVTYNKINQKRNIEIINLNDLFKQELKFTNDQIKTFFENNMDNFKEIYKSLNYIELDTEKLTGSNEFNDLFFERIDEIDNKIAEGQNLDYIIEKFNLEDANFLTFNKFGKDKKSKKVGNFSEDLLKKIFNIDESEPTVLVENKNKYYIFELINIENYQKKINNINVRNEIILNLEKKTKRKLFAEIISKINKKNFRKIDFDMLAKDKNIPIQKITIENLNDNKTLKKEIIEQIYAFGEKKIIFVNDINFDENFLIYIDEVENVSINENSKDYGKYVNLSKIKITNSLYNTYDNYIKNRYKIDINYKALDEVKNQFIY